MQIIRAIAQPLLEITLSAMLYLAFFYFNQMITLPLEVAKGVNWIFLPAGIRIFIALIFDYSGAIGLAIASLIINHVGFYEYDFTSTLGIAIICGCAPLLGRHFVIHNLQVAADLSNISLKQLLQTILAFSLLSSGFHQIWFATRGIESGSWNHFIAMFFGDVIGSILLIAIVKYGIDLIKNQLGRENLVE